MSTGTINHWVEAVDGYEICAVLEYEYYNDPGKLYGEPSDCHPASEELNFWIEDGGEDSVFLNAIESWALNQIEEDDIYDAVMEDIAAERECYAEDMFDRMRDEMIERSM